MGPLFILPGRFGLKCEGLPWGREPFLFSDDAARPSCSRMWNRNSSTCSSYRFEPRFRRRFSACLRTSPDKLRVTLLLECIPRPASLFTRLLSLVITVLPYPTESAYKSD